MSDFLAWIAPVFAVLGVMLGCGFLLAVVIAWSEEDNVWAVMGRGITGFWRFCGELGATLAPPVKGKNPRPIAPSPLVSAKQDFLAGRIGVDEYERRVEHALEREAA